MSNRKVNVAIVGLGFGAEFIPIYQRHPNAEMYAIGKALSSRTDLKASNKGLFWMADTLKPALVPGQLVRLIGPLDTTRF